MQANRNGMTAAPAWLPMINTVGFIVMIAMNALAQFLPLAGKTTGELSDRYPVLLTPPGYVFSIWSVIYILLAGYIIYGWTRAGAVNPSAGRIGLLFASSALLNSAWIAVWHYELLALSVLVMLALLAVLIVIYSRVQQNRGTGASAGETLLVQLPFSLYLGWITVATLVNITVYLYDLGWDGFGWGDRAWLLIGIAVAAAVGIAVGTVYREPFIGLPGAWALSGVAMKAGIPEAAVTAAWLCAALLLLSCLIQAWRRWR
ncbi:tryptophan-rich sensory protein [Paenibacillus pasadenensis]|uniref:tryptophan-rich sensory protein n=1 Tax=Paenibacillus pasadenensis TaxID=217090 RepID=UPI00203BB6D6|nr:tryptophan-rich sensory protein [Paenibacillus pasadenensis]MCM3746855.1 tryptophan-rich sensory protein [Paenibacillus pasadenensis]